MLQSSAQLVCTSFVVVVVVVVLGPLFSFAPLGILLLLVFLWGLISPAAAAAAAGDRENLEHMAGLPLEPLHNNGDHRFLYASAGGGGGGGKVGRRRVSKTRNAATPYERPSVGRHASAGPVQAAAVVANGVGGGEEAEEAPARRGGGGGAWLGVDLLGTASKLVTSGASLFYSSFFGRRQQQQQQQHEDATAPLSVTNNGGKNTGFCSLSLSALSLLHRQMVSFASQVLRSCKSIVRRGNWMLSLW